MKRNVFLCLSLLILSGCESVRFKAPITSKRLISVERNEAGEIVSMACIFTPPGSHDTVILPIEQCEDTIGVSLEEYEKLEAWTSDKVKRLEVCINVRKKCK